VSAIRVELCRVFGVIEGTEAAIEVVASNGAVPPDLLDAMSEALVDAFTKYTEKNG
jgi:hypothetical protein